MNFPVYNDNRTLGLLRKYNVRLQNLVQLSNAYSGQGSGYDASRDGLDLQLAELNRKFINANITVKKVQDEKSQLVSKMAEMKNKYNDIIKSKATLQEDLIAAEEEKLKVSKALIELQITNTKLNEKIQN